MSEKDEQPTRPHFNLDKALLHNAEEELKEKRRTAEQIMTVAAALSMLALGLFAAAVAIDEAGVFKWVKK